MSEEKKVLVEEVKQNESSKIVEKKSDTFSKKEVKTETVNKKVENKVEDKIVDEKITARPRRRGQILAISEFAGTVAVMFDDGKFEMVNGFTQHSVGDFIEV